MSNYAKKSFASVREAQEAIARQSGDKSAAGRLVDFDAKAKDIKSLSVAGRRRLQCPSRRRANPRADVCRARAGATSTRPSDRTVSTFPGIWAPKLCHGPRGPCPVAASDVPCGHGAIGATGERLAALKVARRRFASPPREAVPPADRKRDGLSAAVASGRGKITPRNPPASAPAVDHTVQAVSGPIRLSEIFAERVATFLGGNLARGATGIFLWRRGFFPRRHDGAGRFWIADFGFWIGERYK